MNPGRLAVRSDDARPKAAGTGRQSPPSPPVIQHLITENQLKMPWMTAHRIECQVDHEIAMASALPNPIPLDATVFLVLIRCVTRSV
jgi:hypothetical protein